MPGLGGTGTNIVMMSSIDPRWKLLYTPPPEANGQADPVRPPAHPPFAHVPTVDGFRSPYEPAAANLNRNIHFRSYYDVPVQLREAPQPPPDFVVSNLDSDGHKALAQEVAQRQFGVPILEAQRCRLRITGQREEQAKDLGPAIQLSEFTLYDPSNVPIDLSMTSINCPNGGYSPDYEVVQNLMDGRPDTKFQRKEFDNFPVDIEVDLGAPFLLGSYSWRTAPDTPGRDPVSWQFQVLIGSKWTTLDQVFNFDTPTQRMALVGPFGVDAPINGNTYPSMPPPPPIPQPIIRQSPAPIPRGSPTELATEALLTLLSSGSADHLEMRVNELLWKGADPNARDKKGRTAFVKACAMRDPKIIQSMVNSRADVNAQATSGESGLHRLALFSDLHCMEILLKARADPNVADGEGDTPLMLSAARADPSAVRLLLSYGANPTMRNSRGQTGIDMLDDEFNRQGVVRPSSHEVRALLSSGVGMGNATRF